MVIINSFTYPQSNIRYEQKSVRAVLDKKDLGVGTLLVSESTLYWQEKDTTGFSIEYRDISLHAISKDVNVYPKECLYIIIDGHINMPGECTYNGDDNSDAESEPDLSELILVPEDNPSTISAIYEAIKICQGLNPDPDDIDDDEDNLYVDAEDEMEEEGYYDSQGNRGGGDADIDDLSQRIQENSIDIHYSHSNGNEEEFEDAD